MFWRLILKCRLEAPKDSDDLLFTEVVLVELLSLNGFLSLPGSLKCVLVLVLGLEVLGSDPGVGEFLLR